MRASASCASLEIRVYRPPVLMIHGLWSDASAFADMEQTLAASNYEPFQLSRLDYSSTNDSSFTVNYPLVAAASARSSSERRRRSRGREGRPGHAQHGRRHQPALHAGVPSTSTRCGGSSPPTRRMRARRWPTCSSTAASTPRASSAACSSQAMSGPSDPNRSCFNGAVDDMRVTSPRPPIDLNLGVHPTDVARARVATVFDLAAATGSVRTRGDGNRGPLIVAQVSRACGLVARRQHLQLRRLRPHRLRDQPGWRPRGLAQVALPRPGRTWEPTANSRRDPAR